MKINLFPLEENNRLLTNLLEDNQTSAEMGIPPYESEDLSLGAFEDDIFLGGLTGKIVWNHLHIDLLAVDHKQRKSGIGTALMKKAESIARERQCHLIILETMSWQARGFYEKMGYTVFGKVTNLPIETTEKIYLVKYLAD